MNFLFLTPLIVGVARSEPGQYFFVSHGLNSWDLNVNTYERSWVYTSISREEFEEDVLALNPILDRAKSGIEWIRGIDTDFSKFDGINFEPDHKVYSIKWTQNCTFGKDRVEHSYGYHREFFPLSLPNRVF